LAKIQTSLILKAFDLLWYDKLKFRCQLPIYPGNQQPKNKDWIFNPDKSLKCKMNWRCINPGTLFLVEQAEAIRWFFNRIINTSCVLIPGNYFAEETCVFYNTIITTFAEPA